jgi:uncharacterized membrane protein YeaQ/YmgE (transglycosylase-associated protein family)
MDNNVRRSGLMLTIAGVVGAIFFWWTDPRFGMQRNASYELIDRVNEARIGTSVGIVGAIIVVVIGLWLMTRRTT